MTVPTGDAVQMPGLCTRLMNWEAWNAGGLPVLCRQPAVIHVAYDSDIENGFCCAAHWGDFKSAWPYWDSHDVEAPPCGYPGSLWSMDEKRCFFPEGYPLAEVAARVAVSA